ncbi:hypothetical protein [Fructobacillus papyrifericola]|uniref:Uncharacterized protein n=1 Tax=Fructobacillus papyrifericola TaxID=2713172 RepID=A0ABS5QTW0_9LACO|nr:hypothetical protein [Fructobacillus papyrifericola]MBS9336570.1 hypothetical protein [Fructobacillus papyrifericola]
MCLSTAVDKSVDKIGIPGINGLNPPFLSFENFQGEVGVKRAKLWISLAKGGNNGPFYRKKRG